LIANPPCRVEVMSSLYSTKFPHLITWDDPDLPELPRYHAFIHSFEGLKPSVRNRLAETLEPGERVQEVIVAPSQHLQAPRYGARKMLFWKYRWEPSPDWVLVSTNKRLLVATIPRPDLPPAISSTFVTDILSLEIAEFLLFCWFEWTWEDRGSLKRVRIYFNGVSERFFIRVIESLRTQIACEDQAVPANETLALASLEGLPLKFLNYGRRLLLPGEKLEAVIFQPEIWTPHHRFFRKKKAPGSLVLLTDRGVSSVQEEFLPRSKGYGMTSRFIPRRSLKGMAVEGCGDSVCLEMKIGLQSNAEQVSLSFEPHAEEELRKAVALYC